MSQITVIAGITRSGLTLTMQMLHAGGYPCAGEFPAFEPFPFGTIPWANCGGLAVKCVDTQLQMPPPGDYRVIRLRRDPIQQARSVNKWNNAMGLPSASVAALVGSIRRDYLAIDQWAASQSALLELTFEGIVREPAAAACSLASFIGADLDIRAMANCVIPRTAECHKQLLELELIRRADAMKEGVA